jgi:hypothetical protein
MMHTTSPTTVEPSLQNNSRQVTKPRVTQALIAVVVIGIILRLIAGTLSVGFYHPDEHQQYLEVAQGIAYGYHIRFWEEDRGTRCYLYSGMLAGMLCLLDQVGVRDPVYQATAIRLLLSLSIFGCLLLFARRWLRHGHTVAACFLIALAALSPDMIFISLRTLSETAIMIPLLLGVYLFRRRPLVAGLLFGLMFGIRFQSAFFIAAFGAIAIYEDALAWWRANSPLVLRRLPLFTLRFAAGLTVSILFVGLVDKLTMGDWFHSPLTCFQANIGEGVAAKFGVFSWSRYCTWIWHHLLQVSPLLLPLIVLGAFREPRLACAVLLAVVGHSAIGHKEYRFIWPVFPLALLLVARGFELGYGWLRKRWCRQEFVVVIALSLLLGVPIRCWFIDWKMDPGRSTSLALAKLGRLPGVTGVALYQIGRGSSGNYFFLRRDIPMLTDPDRPEYDGQGLKIYKAELRRTHDRVNYLITWPKNAVLFEEWDPQPIEVAHGMGIYKLRPERNACRIAQASQH